MFKLLIATILAGLATLLVPSNLRHRIEEQAKELSDLLVSRLLRETSEFGSELSDDGRAEQRMWREQRLRDLRELAKER